MLELELLVQFLLGVGGALVLIYLRIYEALPRMSGTREIKLREEEIDGLREKWHEYVKKSEESTDPEQDKKLDGLRDDVDTRESGLRNEIRSLKLRQWTLAATLYIILGGLFAVVVFPLISEGKIISEGTIQSIEALKCMAIGFTWTTYISLITGKTAEKESIEISEKELNEVMKKDEIILNDLVENYNKKIKDIAEDFDKYRKNSKELIDKYKELLGI